MENKNIMASKMAELNIKASKETDQREIDRQNSYQLLIDNENYSPSIEDFHEEINTNFPSRKGGEYLKFLRHQKKRYGNSAGYYNTWGGSTRNDILADEHRKIFNYISKELANKIKKMPVNNVPISLNELVYNKTNVTQTINKATEDFTKSEWTDKRCAAFVQLLFDAGLTKTVTPQNRRVEFKKIAKTIFKKDLTSAVDKAKITKKELNYLRVNYFTKTLYPTLY